MRTDTLVIIVLSLAGAACASSQAEQVRHAQMEQADARAESRAGEIDDQAAVRKEGIEQVRSAVDANVSAANQPGESATHDLVKISEERAQYQSKAQARLDKQAVRIDAAQQKLKAFGPRAPSGLQGDLSTAVQEHKMLEQDVKNLRAAPSTGWESTTERLEQRMSGLDERLSKLTDRIDDV